MDSDGGGSGSKYPFIAYCEMTYDPPIGVTVSAQNVYKYIFFLMIEQKSFQNISVKCVYN